MGTYDHVYIDGGVELPDFPDDIEQGEVEFQTKEFEKLMRSYRINSDGYLLEEEYHTEHVPEEERPAYDEEIGGFENNFEKMYGSMKHVTDGWREKEFHGTMRVITTGHGHDGMSNDTTLEYILKFTDGELEDISKTDRWRLAD